VPALISTPGLAVLISALGLHALISTPVSPVFISAPVSVTSPSIACPGATGVVASADVSANLKIGQDVHRKFSHS